MAAWIEGYVSRFDTEDCYGDINLETCFDVFLRRYRTVFECGVPMLIEHDDKRLCGRWYRFWKDKDGLIGRGEIFRHRKHGRNAVAGILDGSRRDLSIGFWHSRSRHDSSRWYRVDSDDKKTIKFLRKGGRRLIPSQTEAQAFAFRPFVKTRILIGEVSLVNRAACVGSRVQQIVNHGVSLPDFGAIPLDIQSASVSN